MGLFRIKPKCPMCRSRQHSSVTYHEERFEQLIATCKDLQPKLKAAVADQRDEAIIAAYELMLQEAIDETYQEGAWLCLTHQVPELIRADA